MWLDNCSVCIKMVWVHTQNDQDGLAEKYSRWTTASGYASGNHACPSQMCSDSSSSGDILAAIGFGWIA